MGDFLAIKFASERHFSLRFKGTKWIPTAAFPAIPESAVNIASEWRCAILTWWEPRLFLSSFGFIHSSRLAKPGAATGAARGLIGQLTNRSAW